ncbi:uncharacterized protein SAPINGB_P000597 [Magnusiomyces paraingens]|uniref:Elongation of fatty acids protein n=1 Tax=Magnusiomyces paraingens TaxID=2606893 RepID=A0A5E8B134_9ASCO|nr:uncharacterized protein SAPINGB_P000597 [Saprochaete ingens]VVT44977.1 unnamed protein product [Saprochaete ingens]
MPVIHSLPESLVQALTFQTPSLDRPFGFYLWDVVSFAIHRLSGGYDLNKFEFVAGQVPFSTLAPVVAIITSYYVIIFGGQAIMTATGKSPIKLAKIFQIHNLNLTLLSLTLLLLLVEQLIPILAREGLFYAICNSGSWTQPIVLVYYLNYLTKYLEFIDTVFLFLRRKPLTLLHTYHHGATALLCYTQLLGHTSVSWVPISLNLFVHVVMYWYYFQSSRGIRIWWKEWVTRLQIIQFVIDLFFIYFATYTYYATKYNITFLPTFGTCAGEEFAAMSGCFILTSYLFLFIGFYIRVYTKGKKRSAAEKKRNVVVDKEATVGVASGSTVSPASTVSKSRKA